MSDFYLNDIPLPEALRRFEEQLQHDGLAAPLGRESIPLNEKAAGRVLAGPLWAKLSSPHYNASAMDGFAVKAKETERATLTSPVDLLVGDQARYLDTGEPLPGWADAVIPIEETEPIGAGGRVAEDPRNPEYIRIRSAVTPWKHIRAMGEDMVATQLVLPGGHVLRPVDLGAAAAAGYGSLEVARKPRVAIIPSGSELVPVGIPVKAGDIIEFNSIVLAAQIEHWGGIAVRFPSVPDQYTAIRDQLKSAAQAFDLVLLLAGSSAGSEDFSAAVVSELGDLLVHGVAVRPGHPVILGMLDRGEAARCPIIGVPGYPVSSALTGEIFIEPLMARWLGRPEPTRETRRAVLTRKITSPAGDDDYIRVVLGNVNNRYLAAPLTRGAGVITSWVRADGLAVLPRGAQGAAAGDEVEVLLYRNTQEIDRTILATGSHDLTLDLMA
ncbi:MAG: molybdopterin-binding protein, partial [Anaerolineales bacterium]|nr:molybdopterin-binding protein [Anaerolineales bacterium]